MVKVSKTLTLGMLDLESESFSESEDSILFFLEDDFSFFFSFFFLSFLDTFSLFSCFRSDSNDGVEDRLVSMKAFFSARVCIKNAKKNIH